jgi:hypothetical protein
MAHFAKFDPRAFLESQKDVAQNAGVNQTARHSRSLSPETLATLADRGPQHENTAVVQSSTAECRHIRKDRKCELPPAKVAKTKSSVAARASWGEAENDRAAIAEYDGGASRLWAEALARLDPVRIPCNIPPKRWLRFIDDCGRFLDDGWSTRAEALGWGPLDLFGCDRIKPIERLDRAGLLWLIDGRRLLALTADTAAIATDSGGSLTFRRSQNEPGRSLVWELEA